MDIIWDEWAFLVEFFPAHVLIFVIKGLYRGRGYQGFDAWDIKGIKGSRVCMMKFGALLIQGIKGLYDEIWGTFDTRDQGFV